MSEKGPRKRQFVTVLRHRDDPYGENVADNVLHAMTQARIAHECAEISEPLPALESTSTILICTERLVEASPETAPALERFVSEGGGLVVLHRGLHDDFCDLFGMMRQDHSLAPVPDYDLAGLYFPSACLPTFKGLKLDDTLIDGHAAFDVVPVKGAATVATSWTGKPLAWRTRFGMGRVLFWNTSIFNSRRTRGLMLESLQCVQQVSVVPMANVGVVQIDDFPAPLAAPTAELAGVSNPENFYADTWWPDVHRLAAQYDVALTCYAMFDYTNVRDAEHKNPFSMIDSENRAAIARLPPAEVGLHGYNHLPLSADFWPDHAEMAQSLERAIDEWAQARLGPPPTSYVPPMNIFDSDGIATLAATLPSIRFVSGALEGVMGGAVQRDFGLEPGNEALFNLPRATCGCEGTQEQLFDCANEVAALGVWTHYLHPDDLMDVPRPGRTGDPPRNSHSLPWRGKRGHRGLYDELSSFFWWVKSRFPWMAYHSTSDGAAMVKTFLKSEWYATASADHVVVNCPVGGYFRLRANGTPRNRIVTCRGAEILHHEYAEDFCLYVIRAQTERVEVILAPEEPKRTKLERLVSALRPSREIAAN